MNLNTWASIAQIVEAIFVVISVIFIWVQVSKQTKLARAANMQSLVSLSSPLNLELIKDRQVAEFWVLGCHKFNQYDKVDQYRFKSLLIWWLILHENIYYQWGEKLLDESSYKPWDRDLEYFVKTSNLGAYWGEISNMFQDEFASHVKKLIEKNNEQRS